MTGDFARRIAQIMANKKVNTEKKQKSRYATHITTPKGERVYVSAKSKEELDKKVAQLKLEMGAGVDISDNTTFEEYADVWLRVYKKPKVKATTFNQIEGHLNRTIKPVFEGLRLKDIKPLHIQMFLSKISRYCNTVQSTNLSIVRQIFLTAEDNGLILKSPVKRRDKPDGKKTREKEPLTNSQAAQLLAAVKGTPAYLFCMIALFTGMRRGEIMGLMWEDVDFDAGHIYVTHNLIVLKNPWRGVVTTDLKTDAACRRIPLSLPLRCLLEEERRKSTSPYVFAQADGSAPTHHSFDLIWRHVTGRIASEKYPIGSIRYTHGKGRYTVCLDFDCTPHLLRHTYITLLFEAGLDIKQVQYLAGHAKPEVTLQIYTHYRKKQRELETAEKALAAVSCIDVPCEAPGNVISFPTVAAAANSNKRPLVALSATK